MKTKTAPPEIKGQVVYMGPHIRSIGLGYGTIFRNGIHKHLHVAISECPSLAELFVPVANVSQVRRQLAFDYAHNMCGTSGKFVTFYRAAQQWASQRRETKTPPSGVIIETQSHA